MREMKDTGIVWCPSIPSDWKLCRVKDCFTISKIKAGVKNPVVLKLARSGIEVKDVTVNEGQMAESYDDYNPVMIGDLLLNPMDLYSGANCNVSEVEGVISPAYVNLRAKQKINPYFFDYYFKVQYWAMAMFAHGKGVSYDNRWTINAEGVKNYEIPLPELSTQNIIVNIIRKKCSQIDALIANAEQQIAKLKAYKQSVITETLSPNDSWHRCKLGFIASFKNGLNYNGTITDENIKFLGVGDFQDNFIIDDENMLSTLLFDGSVPQDLLLQNGDIVFVRSNGSKELVGRSVLLENITYPLTFSGFCIRMRNKRTDLVLNKFLLYSFWSSRFRQTLNQESKGFNINNLNQGILSKFLVYYPDTQRQKEIIEILDTKRSQIDHLITLKQQKIEKLQQYKKSIIYEYVTGKKEV